MRGAYFPALLSRVRNGHKPSCGHFWSYLIPPPGAIGALRLCEGGQEGISNGENFCFSPFMTGSLGSVGAPLRSNGDLDVMLARRVASARGAADRRDREKIKSKCSVSQLEVSLCFTMLY